MKNATLPPVRVDDALRAAAEKVLTEGESLSAFIEASVRGAVEYRQVQGDFLRRSQAASEEYRRCGLSLSVDEVAERLQKKLDERRQQLGL